MVSKRIIFSIVAIITFLVVFFTTYAIAHAGSSLSPQTLSSLPYCRTISYSGADGFNLLFFGSESEAKEYSSALMDEPPFKSDKGKFNLYTIEDFDATKECSDYKGIAVLCYSRELIKAAAACPHNAIVVLVSRPSTIRSSMYQGVISLNKNHPPAPVLRHEFGHVMGLAEEYVPATLPAGQKNCQSSCDRFGDISDGCFQGCSKNGLYRSKDEGVMRTLDTIEYGKYDDSLVLSALDSLRSKNSITGNAISQDSSCEDQSYYLMKIQNIQDNQFNLQVLSKEKGCAQNNLPGNYNIFSFDANQQSLGSLSINNFVMFTDAPSSTSSREISGETLSGPDALVSVPASEATSSFSLKDGNGNSLASANLQMTEDYLCQR